MWQRVERLIGFMMLAMCTSIAWSQCDPTVPVLTVDLSGSPNATWQSPLIPRQGLCCSTSAPDECIDFIITLDPDAQGIVFDVCAGAVPTGAMYYQIDCGPPTAVGTPVCLNGVGPFSLTFCKPGNNINGYCITSIPEPTAGADIAVNEGCQGILTATGFAPGTLQWTSVAPGATGAYDNYLACPTCANTVVVAQAGYPAYVDYRICGNTISACNALSFCDTVRVRFNSTLDGTILPELPTVCYGAAGTTITVTGSGGTPPYSYLWSTGATTASIFVGPGTYTVQVSDTSQCPPTTTGITVTEFQQPIQALAGPAILVCGETGPAAVPLNASVTGASGGQWTGGNGSFQPSADVLNATYTPTPAEITAGSVQLLLTTTGNGTCPGDTDDLTISFAAPFVNIGLLVTDATCSGSSDGSITVTPTQPGWTYAWAQAPQLDSSVATGLGAGPYSVTVADPSGCDTTLTATIIAPQPISIASVAVTPESCAGLGDGGVSVEMSGGTPPYSYAWSNNGTGPSITVGAGTWTVQVSDTNGCAPATGTGTVVADAQPNVADAGADLIGCQGDLPIALSGSVTNATGGTWSGGSGTFLGTGLTVQYQPSTAEVLANGVDLVLTTTGNTNCPSDQDTVHATLPTSFFSSSIASVNAMCDATSTGSASFIPNTPGFTYLWNDPAAQSGAIATGLAAGSYNVLVTDTYGCDTTLVANITAPAAISIADLAVVDEQCAGNGNGSITATISGGTPPYQYTWSTGAVTPTMVAGAGIYALSVTDANGCAPAQGSATIQALAQPNVADAGADLIGCQGDLPIALSGSVTNATGGTWSGGSGTFLGTGLTVQYQPSTAEVLANGVDLVLTTTGNTNCPSDQDTVHATLPTSFFGSALGSTALACNGDHSGSASFLPDDPSFTYLWNDTSVQSTATATGLSAGTYTVHVTDNYGCDTTASVEITEPTPLSATNVSPHPPSCSGGNDGTASVQAAGGTPGYTYLWSSNANGQTTPTASGLPSGAYTVVVTDANGCHSQAVALLPAHPPLTFAAQVEDTVCVNTPVLLTAQAFGGAGGYTITWAGIGTGDSLQYAFSAGQVVHVSVTDQAGCTGPMLNIPVTVLDLSQAMLHTYGDTTLCPGGTAAVGAWLTGYPGSASLFWPQLPATGNGPFTLPVTSGITLTVIATDVCSNSLQDSITIAVETPPRITLPPLIAEGCEPLTVHFPSDLTDQPVSYLWTFGDGNTSSSIAPVHVYPAGNFTVSLTVTTPLGCPADALTTGAVHAYADPIAAFTADPWETDADHADVQFTDQSTGIISAWDWSFGDESGSMDPDPDHHYMDPGVWHVSLVVTSDHGCIDSVEHIVTVDPVYDITIPNAFTPDPNGGSGGGFDPMDLSNDVFYPFIRFVKDFRMSVFNRWGELVFESDDIKRGWDGYYKGQLSQQDVYVYRIWVRFVDNKEVERIGDVTLFR